MDRLINCLFLFVQAGALLACGIVNSGVRNECDPALALLSDYIEHSNNEMQVGSILGLGLAYAGSNREDVLSLILPVISDSKSSMEVRVFFIFQIFFCCLFWWIK